MIIEIKNKIEFLKKSKINRYSRNVKEFDYTHFIEKLTDKNFVLKCIEDLFCGDLFILRNTLSTNFPSEIFYLHLQSSSASRK